LSPGAEIIAGVVLRPKPLEHSVLRVRGALGHQRELDAERLQPVDRIMRARADGHILFAIAGEAIGRAHGEIVGQRGGPQPRARQSRP
jgi:hypothetical protein